MHGLTARDRQGQFWHHVPGLRYPRFNPFLLGLVDGNLQTVALAGTLWVAWAIADGAVCRVVPIHDRRLCS